MNQAVKIAYVVNSRAESGVGMRAYEVKKRLLESGEVQLDEYYLDGENMRLLKNGEEILRLKKWPGVLGSKSIGWVRLGLGLRKMLKPAPTSHESLRDTSDVAAGRYDLVHLTNQTLSFIADGSFSAVVTVHDIIEVIEPQQKLAYLINRYLYGGITRADKLICVSEYTAKTVKEYFGVSSDRISVIHNGVGPEFYKIEGFKDSVAYQTLRQELKISDGQKVVLYVGSDHPRKNVVGAVRVFERMVKRKEPLSTVFLKVGEAGIEEGRGVLLEEIDRLGIREAVRFTGRVSNEKLNELYNLADVMIYPSRFEGFGLPPLQAMAAGTPVITSSATSLSEVVGDAALSYDPDDVDGMAEGMRRLLQDKEFAEEAARKGLERAGFFTWEKAAGEEAGIYQQLV